MGILETDPPLNVGSAYHSLYSPHAICRNMSFMCVFQPGSFVGEDVMRQLVVHYTDNAFVLIFNLPYLGPKQGIDKNWYRTDKPNRN